LAAEPAVEAVGDAWLFMRAFSRSAALSLALADEGKNFSKLALAGRVIARIGDVYLSLRPPTILSRGCDAGRHHACVVWQRGGGGGEVADSRAHWALHATHLADQGDREKGALATPVDCARPQIVRGSKAIIRQALFAVGEWESVVGEGDARMGGEWWSAANLAGGLGVGGLRSPLLSRSVKFREPAMD